MYYFDKEWVNEHIDKIFDVGTSNWTVAFAGYLLRLNPTQEIFRLMKQHGDYSKAIRVFNNESITQRNLLNHICLGYINGEDAIEGSNSLIIQYISKNNTNQIINLIHSIWYIGKEKPLDESQKERIRQLWKYILNRFSDAGVSEDNKQIVAAMCDWIVIFDTIDDELFNWLKQSIHNNHRGHSLFITEYLLTFIEINPKEVGKLVALYIENETLYLYKQENITEIVKKLYDLDYLKLADKICNLTLQRNEYFLQDVYGSHHQNTVLEE